MRCSVVRPRAGQTASNAPLDSICDLVPPVGLGLGVQRRSRAEGKFRARGKTCTGGGVEPVPARPRSNPTKTIPGNQSTAFIHAAIARYYDSRRPSAGCAAASVLLPPRRVLPGYLPALATCTYAEPLDTCVHGDCVRCVEKAFSGAGCNYATYCLEIIPINMLLNVDYAYVTTQCLRDTLQLPHR